MFGFKNHKKKESYRISIDGKMVPIHIYHEGRMNSRVSVTKTGIHIRIPFITPDFEKKRLVNQFVEWASKKIAEKNLHFDRYRIYQDGDKIEFYDQTYQITIATNHSHECRIQLRDSQLLLNIDPYEMGKQKDEIISKLIYKVLAKKYKPIITAWIHRLNNQFKIGKVNQVRIKNNSTNWGSCSNKGNINISIRLLFAPEEVVEYVLLHELAHLQHQNHSKAYWELVDSICPNYKTHEDWLRKNAKNCII